MRQRSQKDNLGSCSIAECGIFGTLPGDAELKLKPRRGFKQHSDSFFLAQPADEQHALALLRRQLTWIDNKIGLDVDAFFRKAGFGK